MAKPSNALRRHVAIPAMAMLLSASVNADDDVRIGRYQTVTLEAPLQEFAMKRALEAIELPAEVVTRGDALRFVLRQHGYELHAESEALLAAVDILAATLPAEARQRPAEPLRLTLHALLRDRVQVLVDTATKQVLVMPVAQGFADKEIGNDDE